MSNPTLDPELVSWVPVPSGSDFPCQNLPYGVFSAGDRVRRAGVAIGDHILDLAAVAEAGLLDDTGLDRTVFTSGHLNGLLSSSPDQWVGLRSTVSRLLAAGNGTLAHHPDRWLVNASDATMHLPARIGDYVDFYSSIEHATNLGRMFRPDGDLLPPNYRHMPIGYHGRASTVVVSGTDIRRPSGQSKPLADSAPAFGPSRRLDMELEVGFITGNGPDLGEPIALEAAEGHIFGVVLVNHWSARDLQAWEYAPLGPFLGKSFATTISPWVVTMEALAPFRCPPRDQQPEPLPHLAAAPTMGLDIGLEINLNGETISTTSFASMYWTQAQQLTHAASNGTRIRAGDLYASGTVSGQGPGTMGSLIEASWNGEHPIELADGSTRTFLEDGDTVSLRGRCEAPGAIGIGFGRCFGRVLPAI